MTEWYQLPTGVAEECQTRVHEHLLGDSFLYKEVQAGDVSLKAWFVRVTTIVVTDSIDT